MDGLRFIIFYFDSINILKFAINILSANTFYFNYGEVQIQNTKQSFVQKVSYQRYVLSHPLYEC